MHVGPAATINAPVELVWGLLSDPVGYGTWADSRVDAVSPPGSAQPGQVLTISARGLGKRWVVTNTVESVNSERHQTEFRVALPFGIAERSQISCAALDAHSCLVRFG